jgi:hypothetical protein
MPMKENILAAKIDNMPSQQRKRSAGASRMVGSRPVDKGGFGG